MSDASVIQDFRTLADRLLSCAEDRVFTARRMADHMNTIADLEERLADAQRRRSSPRPPSGAFAGVTEAFSRAETEAHNPRALLELAREADEEHRPTPVVPDARREREP